MDIPDHPVLAALREARILQPRDLKFFARNGRSYTGTELPPGTKTWPAGECIPASDSLARRHGWQFRTGFALLARSVVGDDRRWPLRHAWVTRDGLDAVDAVWPDAEGVSYFGLGPEYERWLDHAVELQAEAQERGIPASLVPGAFSRGYAQRFRF